MFVASSFDFVYDNLIHEVAAILFLYFAKKKP
jgi:hypothetical protein